MRTSAHSEYLYADALRRSTFRRFVGIPPSSPDHCPGMPAPQPADTRVSRGEAEFMRWLETQSVRFRGAPASEWE
jgi:hypothetical protein